MLLSSPSPAALAGRFSNWLAIVRANFSCTQKTLAISLSFAGRTENQGLEAEAASGRAPRLMRRTTWAAHFFAGVESRKASARIKPTRERSAARRHTLAPIRV